MIKKVKRIQKKLACRKNSNILKIETILRFQRRSETQGVLHSSFRTFGSRTRYQSFRTVLCLNKGFPKLKISCESLGNQYGLMLYSPTTILFLCTWNGPFVSYSVLKTIPSTMRLCQTINFFESDFILVHFDLRLCHFFKWNTLYISLFSHFTWNYLPEETNM